MKLKAEFTMTSYVKGLVKGGIYNLTIVSTMATSCSGSPTDFYHYAAYDEAGNFYFIAEWQADVKILGG